MPSPDAILHFGHLPLVKTALKETPDDKQAHYNLGVAIARGAEEEGAKHGLDDAEQHLRRVVELRGDEAFAVDHLELAKVLARQNKTDDAVASYLEAAKKSPGDYRIFHSIGLVYDRAGDRLRAAQAYQQALAVRPQHLASAIKLGDALLAMNRPQDAAISYRHALDFDPQNAEARAGLARAQSMSN